MESYINLLLTPDFKRKELLKMSGESLHNLISYMEHHVLGKVTESQLNMEVIYEDKSLTMAKIIYHLAYYEDLYFNPIIRQALYNEEIKLPHFVEESLTRNLDKNEVDMWLNHLISERKRNIYIVEHNFKEYEHRVFLHYLNGRMNFDDVTQNVLRHDRHHLEQIMHILQQI